MNRLRPHRWLCTTLGWCWAACVAAPVPDVPTANIKITAALSANDWVDAIRFTVMCADGTALSADVATMATAEVAELNIPEGHRIADLYAVLPKTQCEVMLTALDSQSSPIPTCNSPTTAIDVPDGATEEVVVYLTCTPPTGEGISGCLVPADFCDMEDPTCSWQPRPTNTPCNDGLSCTVGNTCDGTGICGTADSGLCNDGIPCTDPECDPVFGCIGIPTTPDCNTDCPKGDVTGNNSVDVVDAQCTILLTLWQLGGMTAPVPTCLKGGLAVADLDCYGTINVADVILIISFALQQPLSVSIDRNNNHCHDHCDQQHCGDGVCLAPEDCLVCPEDCGACPGSCCEAHATPGCESPDIADCVCAVSPNCCSVLSTWSDTCVTTALQCNAGCP